MSLLKSRSIRFYLGFILILAMAIGGTAVAFAAPPPCAPSDPNGTTCGTSSTTASAQVNGGSLSESGDATAVATPVTLTGINTSTSYAFNVDVNDARGNGNGWHLTMSATQFQNSSNTHSLSVDASTLKGVGAACVLNVTCSPAGVAQNTGANLKTTTTIYSAAVNTGMGDWTITPAVNVAILANTFADTYTSTVTVTLVAGP